MISTENVDDLREAGIHYIVGARLDNLTKALFAQVDDTLERKDGSIIRLKTDIGSLICSFSKKRYNKDKHERQINGNQPMILDLNSNQEFANKGYLCTY